MDRHYVVSNTIETHWKPLEDALGTDNCEGWMYMSSFKLDCGTVVHAYKHNIRKNYLTLSDDGRAWKYGNGTYEEVDRMVTIAEAVAEACIRRTA